MNRLERIETLIRIGVKNLLTTEECALWMGISEDRLRHLASDREIPHYKKNGRLFFAKSEIEEWQTTDKVPSRYEIAEQATQYLYNH